MMNPSATSPVRSTQRLPFTQIPRTSALFTDYLYAQDRVSRFYEHPWEGVDGLVKLAPSIASAALNRNRVADALAEQNRAFGSSDLTFEHIEMLRRPDAVAVVTGQQAGLFGGPLFTVYKALTAILLAERMREKGVPAVPVFWIASEDHDFDEVNHVAVASREGDLRSVTLDPCGFEPDRPVGQIGLCTEIGKTVDQLFDALPRTVFTEQLRADLAAAYGPGAGFAEGFARLMAKLFAPFGVILLDPLAPKLKDLAASTYIAAIANAPEIASALVARSQELVDAGYHAQVFTSPDMTPLFILDENRRRAMVQRDGIFELKTGGHSYSREDLLAFAEDCPSCLSPNVTLRPAVQDTLLPTVAYIGGPAEVAYFAQLQPVYHIVGRPMPVIVPRASATLLDHTSSKTLDRYGLSLEDFFEGHETLARKIVEGSVDAATASLFDDAESHLHDDVDRLGDALGRIDPTLVKALENSRRKMLYQMNRMRMRFVRVSAERDVTTRQRLTAAESMLFPDKGLQERSLNVFSFLALTGYPLIEDLASALDPESRDHQLIELGGVPSQIFVAGS